jgi:hypothetical protein
MRISADRDRRFGTLLRRAGEALRDPLRWVFARPVLARKDLIRAVTERLDCLLLSDLHDKLKAMRYRVLVLGTLASCASREGRLTFTNQVWRAMGFSRVSLRDEAATKMDDGLAARFLSYSSHETVLTALDAAGTAFADACLRMG